MKTRRGTLGVSFSASNSPSPNKSRAHKTQVSPKAPSSRRKVQDTALSESLPAPRTRRTRRVKEIEALDQTVVLENTLPSSPNPLNKSRGTRARKKPSKTSEAAQDEALESSARKSSTKIEEHNLKEDSEAMSSEDVEVMEVSRRISRLKSSKATSSPASDRRSRSARARIEDFTPESSPLTVNLTPHRSKKTPRKSPMNLSSPKTHEDAPLRLSKTPRKLPIVVESPAPSEHSPASTSPGTPTNSSPKKSKKDRRSSKSRRSDEKASRSPKFVRKFSKSPKIVLRSPKAKSSKSRTPRVSGSKVRRTSVPKRASESPQKMRTSLKSVQKSPAAEKEVNPESSPKRVEKDVSKISPTPVMSVQLSRIDSPGLRDKLTTRSPRRSTNTTRSPLRGTPVAESKPGTPARSPSAEKRLSQGGESPHRARSSTKKRSGVTDSGTPLRPTDDSPPKSSAVKCLLGSPSNSTPIEPSRGKTRGGSAGVISSSTPRDRIRRSLHLSPELSSTRDAISSPLSLETPAGSSTMINERPKRRSFRLEDESIPVIDDNLVLTSPTRENSRLDVTHELTSAQGDGTGLQNEEIKPADGTYELAEPKTPNLRRKAGKRSFGEIEEVGLEERPVKRTCRVRFASPGPNNEENRSLGGGLSRVRSATPGHRGGKKIVEVEEKRLIDGPGEKRIPRHNTSIVKRSSHVHNISGIAELDVEGKSEKRRRSSSVTNLVLSKTPVGVKRRSSSVSESNARSAGRTNQLASANRLSKPRLSMSGKKAGISETKTPVARKAPNFAEIHQKKFAMMESLVDAKKRVEKRHLAMSSQIPTALSRVKNNVPAKALVSSQPIAPVVAVNGNFNRYGFKLRKDDAMKIVSKQPGHISKKKQNENRQLLKGVRTNRRFDLIMKARNINV